MDITSNQLKKMKAKQLRGIIREAILEVLNEAPTLTPTEKTAQTGKVNELNQTLRDLQTELSNINSGKDASTSAEQKAKRIKSIQDQIKLTQERINNIKKGTEKLPENQNLSEDELDEANVGGKFKLAPNVNPESFTGKKKTIITKMQDAGEEPMTKADVAIAMGYTKLNKKGQTVAKQQPIDSEFNALVSSRTIVPADTQTAPRFSRPQPAPGEEPEEPKEIGPESIFGFGDASEEDVRNYLLGKTSSAASTGDEDEDEDETPTIEPEETEEIPTPTTTDKNKPSPADVKALDDYDELKLRLERTKSNIRSEKQSATDISGEFKPTKTKAERIKELETTKKGLENRIEAIVAGSKYVQDKLAARQEYAAKKSKSSEIKPVITPEEEEKLDENYAYEIRQLQYRAGIIK